MNVMGTLKRIFAQDTAAQPGGRQGKTVCVDWSFSLGNLEHMLVSIIRESEGGFLDLGRKLSEFYDRSRDMCAASGSVVRTLTGNELKSALNGLGEILEQLDGNLKEYEANFSNINEVFRQHVASLQKVSSSLDAFTGLTLNLTMLGFVTKVENAHIKISETGFDTLTDNVRGLSDTIRGKSAHINEVSCKVKVCVEQALAQAVIFMKEQSHSMWSTHERAVQNHAQLSRMYHNASGAVETIEERSREIADSIGNIVMSLQFHDIIRQQLEHVGDVLKQLGTRIVEEGTDHKVQAGMAREVLALQHSQLVASQEDITRAVTAVMENLRAISNGVSGILKETNQIALSSDHQGVSIMADIEEGIRSVIECMRNTAAEQASLTDTVRSASEMVSEMSVFVRDIEALGLDLQLIALNARIKAAHLGSEGAALDVVSGSIYELSKNARQDTRMLADLLSALVDLSVGFKVDLGALQDRLGQTADIIVGKMNALSSSLDDINDSVITLLNDMSGKGDSLMTDIQDTADGTCVHEEFCSMLDRALLCIDDMRTRAERICPDGDDGAARSFLTDIHEIYTMKSERDIHAQHTFVHGDAQVSADAGHSDDLGENVELF